MCTGTSGGQRSDKSNKRNNNMTGTDLCQRDKYGPVGHKGQQSNPMRGPRHVFKRDFQRNYQNACWSLKKDDTAFLDKKNCIMIYYLSSICSYMSIQFICSVYSQNNTFLLHDIITIQLIQLNHYRLVFISLHQLTKCSCLYYNCK